MITTSAADRKRAIVAEAKAEYQQEMREHAEAKLRAILNERARSSATVVRLYRLVALWAGRADVSYHPEDYLYNVDHAIVLKAVLDGWEPEVAQAEVDAAEKRIDGLRLGDEEHKAAILALLNEFGWAHPYA